MGSGLLGMTGTVEVYMIMFVNAQKHYHNEVSIVIVIEFSKPLV